MKHLNPRQGITTKELLVLASKLKAVLCETPKSPPGDYNTIVLILTNAFPPSVKHLNPRQGITTYEAALRQAIDALGEEV